MYDNSMVMAQHAQADNHWGQMSSMAPSMDGKSERKRANRPSTRNLVRWTDDMDIQLLLHLQKVCNHDNIKIPWDKVGAQMGASITGGAILQHLSKLRARRVALGLPVPEPLKRGGGWGLSAPAHKSAAKKVAAAAPGSGNGNAGKRGFDDASESEYEDPKGSHQRKRVKRGADPNRSKQAAGKTVAKHNHPEKGTSSVLAPTEYASNFIKKEAPDDGNSSTFPMESIFNSNRNETAMAPSKEVVKLAQSGPILNEDGNQFSGFAATSAQKQYSYVSQGPPLSDLTLHVDSAQHKTYIKHEFSSKLGDGHWSQVQTSKHSESLRSGGILTLRFRKESCLTFLRRIDGLYNSSSTADNFGILHHNNTSSPSQDDSTATESTSSGHISFGNNSLNHLTANGRETIDTKAHHRDQMKKTSANGTNSSYGNLKYDSLSGYLSSTGNEIFLNSSSEQLLANDPVSQLYRASNHFDDVYHASQSSGSSKYLGGFPNGAQTPVKHQSFSGTLSTKYAYPMTPNPSFSSTEGYHGGLSRQDMPYTLASMNGGSAKGSFDDPYGSIKQSVFDTPTQKPRDTSSAFLLTQPFKNFDITTSAPETSQVEVKSGGISAIDGSKAGTPSQEGEQAQAKDSDLDLMSDEDYYNHLPDEDELFNALRSPGFEW